MNIQHEINKKIYGLEREQITQIDYAAKFRLYKAIIDGDMEAINLYKSDYHRACADPVIRQHNPKFSDSHIQNVRYQFVIFASTLVRICIQYGLERETSLSICDVFIYQMDHCKTEAEIYELQYFMIQKYTKIMKSIRSKNIVSKQVLMSASYIFSHLAEPITLPMIADHVNLSPAYLSRLFKKETGISISAYIKEERLKYSAQLLIYGDKDISEIAQILQFSSQSHFTRDFRDYFGMTPKKFRTLHESVEQFPNAYE